MSDEDPMSSASSFAQIEQTLAGMMAGRALDRPPEFIALCKEVAARPRREWTDEEIERLAEELSHFTD